MTTKRREVVFDSEVDRYGVYLWQMPNGAFVSDDEGNFLSIAADIKTNKNVRVARLTEAARELGITEGQAVFFPGHRKVDEEEFERQKARAALGLIPDELDVAAYKEMLDRGVAK